MGLGHESSTQQGSNGVTMNVMSIEIVNLRVQRSGSRHQKK